MVIRISQVFNGYGFYKKTLTGPFNLHKTFFNLKMEYEICRMCIWWKYIFILFFTTMWKAYTYPLECLNDIVIIYYASFFPSAMLHMVRLGPMKVLCRTCFGTLYKWEFCFSFNVLKLIEIISYIKYGYSNMTSIQCLWFL